MSKRVTIHDIAREAGVSAATVSYVINNTQGQSISEETKNKIWHVINMFNYKPNVFARNLRSSGSKLVAVCTEIRSYIEKAEFVNVLEQLSRSLHKNFGLIYAAAPFGKISNADAIIAYNVSKETFYEIGNLNYIPLIAVNCSVEDKLFFQVTPDYGKLRRRANERFNGEYTFVCPTPADSALKSQIETEFKNAVFIETADDLQNITAENILAVQSVIAEYFSKRGARVYYEDLYAPVCEQTADCLNKALSREPFDIHSYKV